MVPEFSSISKFTVLLRNEWLLGFECRNELFSLGTGDLRDWGHGAELEGCGWLVPLLQAVVLFLQVEILNTSAIHIYNHRRMWTDMHTSWPNNDNHFFFPKWILFKEFPFHQSIEVQTNCADRMPIQRNGKHFLPHLWRLKKEITKSYQCEITVQHKELCLFHWL